MRLPHWHRYEYISWLTTNEFIGLQLFGNELNILSQRSMNKRFDAHWKLTRRYKCNKCGKIKARVISEYR